MIDACGMIIAFLPVIAAALALFGAQKLWRRWRRPARRDPFGQPHGDVIRLPPDALRADQARRVVCLALLLSAFVVSIMAGIVRADAARADRLLRGPLISNAPVATVPPTGVGAAGSPLVPAGSRYAGRVVR